MHAVIDLFFMNYFKLFIYVPILFVRKDVLSFKWILYVFYIANVFVPFLYIYKKMYCDVYFLSVNSHSICEF